MSAQSLVEPQLAEDHLDHTPISDVAVPGRGRVRVISTIAFTVMFAVWLMFGYIALSQPDGSTKQFAPWNVGVMLFTVLAFVIGIAMGIGKAAVYKHIPEYFPHDVGAVGGLVGSLGALGGFFLPPLFAYASAWTGAPQSTFGVLFAVTAAATIWMHITVVRLLHQASPQLANKFEHDQQPAVSDAGAVGSKMQRAGAR
jgi:NNP family nitrate/nitrite transporter-like MFS transporter